MATSLTLKCTKTSEEKSWQTGKNNKPMNRHTIEFEVGYEGMEPNEFQGSTTTLQTMDKKVYDQYNVGDEYTLTIKK